MKSQSTTTKIICTVAGAAIVVATGLVPLSAQVRNARRATTAKTDNRSAAAGPNRAAVKGEDGYATAGPRGAVVKGDEGYAAVGRNGNVATGGDVDVDNVAVGRRGAVVVGEEGAAAVGRHGTAVVGNRYESYDAWRAVAAVGTSIAIGTMLANPPSAAVPIALAGSSYYYHDGVYFTRVMSSGEVAYQVVEAPAGAIISSLPGGCQTVQVGGMPYSKCGTTHYQKVSNGYMIVAVP